MSHRATLLALLSAVFIAAPVFAEGRLGTLPKGHYDCGLPGNASAAAWKPDPKFSFWIRSASRYGTAEGGGTYLLEGKTVTFTRGPMKDMRFRLTGSGLLRQVGPDGSVGRLRCSLSAPLH